MALLIYGILFAVVGVWEKERMVVCCAWYRMCSNRSF